jgi:hypothetical protein
MSDIIKLSRHDALRRAFSHLSLTHVGSDGIERPVAYRLDESGLLGGDDPEGPHCADVSYGGRTLTSDCIGFALYCAKVRLSPGHIEMLVREPLPNFKALTIGCSPRFGRDTAIGVGPVWTDKYEVVRPRNYTT